ncbi:hypothetical protein ASC80_16365 [Afipia sp. Root123D2]|nr:hypothetical protein ASC80_16365 [Afipia sp. Root123D2]
MHLLVNDLRLSHHQEPCHARLVRMADWRMTETAPDRGRTPASAAQPIGECLRPKTRSNGQAMASRSSRFRIPPAKFSSLQKSTALRMTPAPGTE